MPSKSAKYWALKNNARDTILNPERGARSGESGVWAGMKMEENSAEVKREKENLKMIQNAVQTIGGIPTGKFDSLLRSDNTRCGRMMAAHSKHYAQDTAQKR
jgi:hypothetical protein